MLEKQTETLMRCNMRRLEQQFENEDTAKEILIFAKDKPDFKIAKRQKFLNKRLKQRESLYIYPEQVTV